MIPVHRDADDGNVTGRGDDDVLTPPPITRDGGGRGSGGSEGDEGSPRSCFGSGAASHRNVSVSRALRTVQAARRSLGRAEELLSREDARRERERCARWVMREHASPLRRSNVRSFDVTVVPGSARAAGAFLEKRSQNSSFTSATCTTGTTGTAAAETDRAARRDGEEKRAELREWVLELQMRKRWCGGASSYESMCGAATAEDEGKTSKDELLV